MAVTDYRYNSSDELSGRVNSLAFHPQTAGTYYVGAAGGGVWKTTDSGGHWTSLSNTPEWESQQVSSIAVDPKNGQTLYAGTGDLAIGLGGMAQPFGLLQSKSGGMTWTKLAGSTLGKNVISTVVVDPDNSNIITVAEGMFREDRDGNHTKGKVWRSKDGGQTFRTAVNATADWLNVAVSAPLRNRKRYYYAAGISPQGELWRSKGGAYKKLRPPVRPNRQHLSPLTQYDVACSPTDPNTVYVLYYHTYFLQGDPNLTPRVDRAIYKSINGGGRWTNISVGFPHGDNSNGNQDNWSQADYDFYIACSKSTSSPPKDVVYVGLIDLAQSPDSGTTWRSIGGPTYAVDSGGNALARTHNDQHCLAVNPSNPTDVLIGNDGGVYRVNAGGSGLPVITGINSDLGVGQHYAIDANSVGSQVLVGSQDNGLPFSNSGIWRTVGGGDGGPTAVAPTNPDVQYGSRNGLFILRTTDAWVTRQSIVPGSPNLPAAFLVPIHVDPNDENALYMGDSTVNRWTNSGGWQMALGGVRISPRYYVTCLAVAPCDKNVIYAGTLDGHLAFSSNRGATWKKIQRGLPLRSIAAISISPGNPYSVLVALSGFGAQHLWQCNDTRAGTPAWTSVSGAGSTALPDTPLTSIALDPDRASTNWFVSTDVGVFYTDNSGGTWANATQPNGLPNVPVFGLKAVAGKLFCATYGRGVWGIDLPPAGNYILTDLGKLGGSITQSGSINEAGYVVGFSQVSGHNRAFIWRPTSPNATTGTMQALGDPVGGDQTVAYDINNGLQVCGTGILPSGNSRGFLDRTVLGTLGGDDAFAIRIDNAGKVYGMAQVPAPEGQEQRYHAAAWPGPVDLHGTVAPGAIESQVTAASADSGMIGGWFRDSSGYHGFLYPNPQAPGQRLVLEGMDEDDMPLSINNCGQAVGIANNGQAAMWLNGNLQLLGFFGRANHINEIGEIVGDRGARSVRRAFIRKNGVVTDLNTRIPSGTGWVLESAISNNTRGQIVGYGKVSGEQRAFLLTPR